MITAANSTGEAVVQYFSGQMNTQPEACGSFLRMKDDNSLLSDKCGNWGGGVRGDSKWGILGGNKEYLLYDHAAFRGFLAHWIVGIRNGRWECDDFRESLSIGDFWRIYVR